MISYKIACGNCNCTFDSWFASSSAYDKIAKSNMLSCESCGSTNVQKALMAPSVNKSSISKTESVPKLENRLSNSTGVQQRELSQLIRQHAEDTGANFAKEAEKMADGISAKRSIYGTATPQEAEKLLDKGLNIIKVPMVPFTDS